MLKGEITWTSAAPGARSQFLSEIGDQHLSNILWFNEIFNGVSRYNSKVHFFMGLELAERGVKRLPWKPLPVLREVQELKRMGMIHVSGSIIKGDIYSGNRYDYEIIGSIAHIEGWEDM
jgi:hypothetical protein